MHGAKIAMRRKYKKIVRISIVILIFLVYLIASKPSNSNKNNNQQQSGKILVAKKTLMPGYLIKPEDVYWQKRNKKNILPDHITANKPIASTVKKVVNPNEIILKSNIEKIAQGSTAAARVQQSLTAANVNVKKSHLTTTLQPGDKVNLIFNKTFKEQYESIILLKNILVIAKSAVTDANMHLLLEIPTNIALELEKIKPYGYFSITLSSSYMEKNQHSDNLPLKAITHIDGDHKVDASIIQTNE